MAKAASILPLTEAFYYILLSLYGGPSHGYAIMQSANENSGGEVTLGAGTLYTALGTLLKKGLIVLSEEPDETDARRKVYRLTTEGKSVLDQELQRLERLVRDGHRTMKRGGESE